MWRKILDAFTERVAKGLLEKVLKNGTRPMVLSLTQGHLPQALPVQASPCTDVRTAVGHVSLFPLGHCDSIP